MQDVTSVDANNYDPTDHDPAEIVVGRRRLSDPTWNGLLREALIQYLDRPPNMGERNQTIEHINNSWGIRIVAGDNSGNKWTVAKDRFGAFSFLGQDAKDCWQKSMRIAVLIGGLGGEEFGISVVANDKQGKKVHSQFKPRPLR